MTKTAIDGLHANHADMAKVFESLSDAEWVLPSACAGWRIQEVLAHVTSNFHSMVHPEPPDQDAPPPPDTAEEMVEVLLTSRREWSPAALMAEYAELKEPALASLAALQEEPLASTEIPLADLGTYGMHWLANAYCFDHYCHLRHDTLAPLGSIIRSLPEPDDVRLRPGIDWMIAGLPQMCRATASVSTKPWQLALTGPGGGTWTIYPAVDGGLVSVVEESDSVAATVTSSAHDFVAWGTQRTPWRSSCTLTGDSNFVSAVLDAINII